MGFLLILMKVVCFMYDDEQKDSCVLLTEAFCKFDFSSELARKRHCRYVQKYKKGTDKKCYSRNTRCKLILCSILLLCGDVETNPGPTFFCPLCDNEVKPFHFAVQCNDCGQWYHLKCVNTTQDVCTAIVAVRTVYWMCKCCKLRAHKRATMCNCQKRLHDGTGVESVNHDLPNTKRCNRSILQEHSYCKLSCNESILQDHSYCKLSSTRDSDFNVDMVS